MELAVTVAGAVAASHHPLPPPAEENPKKRRKEGVDDTDSEEPLVAVQLSGMDGMEDDGCTKICWPARLLAPYTGSLEAFWKAQPRVVRPLRESYASSFLRMDGVNATTTLRDHDRGARRTIKLYAKDNIRVTKTKAIITSSGYESHDVGLANNFAECTGVYQLISALWQYTTNLFLIRRDDFSGLLMLRVLHDIKFFIPVLSSAGFLSKAQRDAKQVEIVRHFIDESLEENSTRGRLGLPPMVYEESLKKARSAAGLIFSGSGTSLGLDVGLDAAGLDPYSCKSSSTSASASALLPQGPQLSQMLQLPPPPPPAQPRPQSQRPSRTQRRVAAAVQRHVSAAAVAGGAATGAAATSVAPAGGVAVPRDNLCRDWNLGRCLRPTCK